MSTPALVEAMQAFILRDLLPPLAWDDLEHVVTAWFARHDHAWHATTAILPCLTCAAAGGAAEDAVPLAGFWALSFFAGELFDSIQDDEDHAQPWMQGGHSAAISRGLALIALANSSLGHTQPGAAQGAAQGAAGAAGAAGAILRAFGRAWALAAKSQTASQSDRSLEGYFANIIASTGHLFATAAWAGGRLATDAPAVLDALSAYGLATGTALAITSDCHGVADDTAAGIYKLPMLYALSLEQHPHHAELCTLLDRHDPAPDAVARILSMMDEMQATPWALGIAAEYRQRAVAALQPLPAEQRQPLIHYVG